VYGADLFSNCWLFYLSFINHNKYFSVLNYIRHRKTFSVLPDVTSDIYSSAFVCLIQIQLSLSYAYTGIEKLKGMQWWEGSAVWYVVGMRELVAVDLSYLRYFPTAIAIMSMATVIFEVYFIFAVANKKLRPYWLLLGLGLHLGIAGFMSLPFFGIIMMAPYILFLDAQKLRLWAACFIYKFKSRRT
ncbi:MAG: HTTM domain-containing protein, partial [Bdellovibrionota bacterium]